MKVSVQTTTGLERRMEVQVPAARVDAAVQARLNAVSRTARLQGFRPGKVPPAVIRQRFGGQVQQEVVEDLVRRSFAEAVMEQKLSPAGGPRIDPVTPVAGEDLKYTAVFEVYPDIELKGLETLEVERPVVQITAADIDGMVEHLRRQRPNWVAVDRAAQTGDRVIIDFEGRIDGAPFEGGKGQKAPVVLGASGMLPDLEAGLMGMQAGSGRIIPVTFPDDYHAAALAGKTAGFEVRVNAVEAPELPALDEAFCASYGLTEGGVEEFRRQIERNMLREVEQGVRARMRGQALEKLFAAHDVPLPAALVDDQINDMQVQWGRQSGVYEVDKIPPREAFEKNARRRVALGLLIGAVIEREQIKADPAQVQQRLEAVVAQAHDARHHHHDSPHEHRRHLDEMMQAYRRDRQAMSQIESMVLEEQAIERLLSQARVTEKTYTFKEFTRAGE
jgi:trigger factor